MGPIMILPTGTVLCACYAMPSTSILVGSLLATEMVQVWAVLLRLVQRPDVGQVWGLTGLKAVEAPPTDLTTSSTDWYSWMSLVCLLITSSRRASCTLHSSVSA